MGNVIMKAQQITYGASNVEKALDDLKAPELIELNKRMDTIDAWQANVHEVTYTGSELTINNALALPARSLITEIEAIQDLHGLPFPYVGGAYKNKLDSSAVTQGSFDDPSATANCVSDYTPISGGADYYMSGNSGYADGIYLRFYDANKTELDTSTRISKYVVAFGFTAPSAAIYARIMWYKSGTITPSDIATAQPQLELGTSATTFAPYSNICPISGRTAVAVDDLPKADYAPFFEGVKNGTYGFVDLGTLNWKYNSTNSFFWLDPDALPNKQLGNLSCAIYNYVGAKTDAQMATVDNMSIALSSGNNIKVKNTSYTDATTFTTAMSGVYLIYELATPTTPSYTAEQWAALVNSFGGNNVTIQLGTTVYGADINWDTGAMTVKTAVVDMGSLEWFKANTHRFQSTDLNGLIYPNSENVIPPNMKCEIYKPFAASETSTTNFGVTAFGYENTMYLRVLDANIDDLTAFMAQIDGKKLEYELATPTTIQLTPTQLEMLKGYNRVTLADGYGEIELKALVLGGDN